MPPDPPTLKTYAVTPQNSRGREHPEQFPASVDPIAIDRQRVLHAAAFRRLEYKTQVFVSGEHDHFRSRLTHSLEVASVARRLCVALQVNGAVGELIALTHDLGHPPFGHAGEVALGELMAGHGGFEHNAQSLRVVEFLEHPYPAFRGLNLTYEVRESLAKHCTHYDSPGLHPTTSVAEPRPSGSGSGRPLPHGCGSAKPVHTWHPLADGKSAPIEGQIANLADRVAYDCHDLEDAIGAGMVQEADLRGLDLWMEAAKGWRERYPDVPLAAIRRPILDGLEALMMDAIVSESRRRIKAARLATLDDVRACGRVVVALGSDVEAQVAALESFLLERVYRHPRLIRMDTKAKRFIERLFAAYLEEPRMLPPRFVARIAEQGPHRVICDYIAGMTDRFCQDEYKRLFEPFERV